MTTPSGTQSQSTPPESKRELRSRLNAARRTRALDQRDVGTQLAAYALAWEPVRRADTVACYVAVGAEPPTRELLDGLRAADKRVLLPVVLPDLDLDWAEYTGPDSLAEVAGPGKAVRGLMEPTGARLGVDAVSTACVVLAPGLAVSHQGVRLGQGGGCYDRALSRINEHTPVAVVLFEDEVGVDVPAEPHDRRVTHALTPAGVTTLV